MQSKIYRSRFLVCILSLMIIFTTIFPVTTFAAGNLGVTVGSVTGVAGGSVEVPVSLSNIPNDGLAGTSIIITFDSTKLTLTGVSAGGIVPTVTDVWTNINDVIQSPGKAKVFYSDDNGGLSNTHITSNGVLANLTFSIAASASGSYTLGVDAASDATQNDFDVTTIPYTGMDISTGTVTLIPTISPATASFDKNLPSDKLVTVTLNGNDLNSITNGAYTLGSQDCETTLMPNMSPPFTPTWAMTFIKSDYLSQQSVGTTILSFNFSGGSSQTFTITVVDTSPASTNYTVTYNAGANGSISGSGNESVTSGAYPASVPTVTPSAGYNFAYWSSDGGTTQLTSAQLAAQTISANVTYTAYYTATANQTYTVTFDSQGGSAVTSISNVTTGSSITAPTAPTWAGHNFGGWYKEAGCTNAWTFNTDTVTNNVTIYAKWTAAENLGVTIGSVTGEAGGSVTVPVSLSNIPSVGVVATSIIVTFDSTKLTLTGVSAGGIVPTAADIATNINDVIQSPGKAKIFYFDENAGIGNPDTHITTNGVLANLTFSINASANGEYNFGVDAASEITDNDVNTIDYGGMNISTGNLTVNAAPTYTLTYNAGAHGSITGTTPQTVNSGASGSAVTAVADVGYHFVSWSDNVTTATRTDSNVAGNISVTATFAADVQTPAPTIYTLNYTAGANGTITGTTAQTVTSGASGSAVTAASDAGYHFVSWSDGVTTATRTDSNVTGNLSVTATFAIDAKVPGAPTAVVAVAGNGQAIVSFSPPTSDGGSAITGYTVTSNPSGITATGTNGPITVSGLTNGTAYTFTVTATNAVGTGAASSASTSVTPKAEMKVPGAPTAVAAVAGNAQATVGFSAPSSDGGSVITGYTVTSNPGGITATGTNSPIIVSGLTNGTAYTFTVTATNTIGIGPASTASTSVTPLASAVFEITAVTTPANATITGTNILANVDNTTTSVTVDVSVSEKASWKLYSDAACTLEITNQPLSLLEGINLAYIKVSASDGKNSKIYTLKVIRALKVLKTGRSILEYSLAQQTGFALINQAAQTVSLEVTSGTSLTGLRATFTLSPGAKALIGSVEQVSADSSNDFSGPVVYTIQAEDGKTAQWTVTVKVTQSKEKNILGFSLPGQTGSALINNANGTIDVEVNETTDPGDLIAGFELSAKAQAKVGGQLQVSGASNNNYTDPVEYQVIAEDGSQKNWTVTVSVRTTTPTVTLENIQNGGIITNSRPIFSGKTSKKSLPVTLYLDGSLIGSTSANYYKEWNFTPTGPLADGTHKLRIEVNDGNLSGQTDERTFIVVTVNSAQITLTANPTTLVGDGLSTTTLEVFVQSNKQIPLAGVSVNLKVSAGTLSSNQVITGADGKAQVTMTAPRLSGVVPRQEYVTARVNREDLNVESSLEIQFQPASIEGIVLDRSQADRPPIVGAQVELKEDLDNDGVIDFTASTTTGADGRYKIYVPVGNRSYTPIITIPVQVGSQTISMQISQRTDVGELSGVGETINANQNISGKLMLGQADGNGAQEIQQVFSGDNVSASLLTSLGEVVQGTVQVNSDGSFNIENVLPGDYTVRFNITAPNGEQLASQTAQVSVRQEGEMSVAITLIDPYGLVTDETSGELVSGVNMQLYWADTTLNIEQGRQAETLVNLPELPTFPPNRNLVPQLTSSTGEYAWMVFPDGDYYIVAEKSGYQTYDSREEKRNVAAKTGEDSWVTDGIIHVGQTIVNYDLKICPEVGAATVPGAPTEVSAEAGNAQATVSFSAPASDGGSAITDYIVTSNPGGITATGTASPIIVSGLTNGTAYTFTVTATNAVGIGAASSASISVTPVTTSSGGSDGAGSIAAGGSQTVTKPVITLAGEGEVAITINSPYEDLGATAKDGYGVDITGRLVILNAVNPTRVGDYTVTYNVTDSEGNVADQVIRTVHVTGVGRLAGGDSVDTALEIAKASYTEKVSNVILATSENYPDALAGSVLAYRLKAPILLVGNSDEDQEKVLAYMQADLDPTGTVYILGGYAAVSKDMEQKIKYQGFQKINRLYGEDGYETAERIVEHMNVSTGTPIVIVSGENYPDALSISSMAAYNQYPIFLAKKDELMDSVRKEISAIKPSKVYIIGLQRSISTAVEEMVSQMIPIEKANIIRIGGLDRYETSLEIAKQFNSSGKLACVATGNNFPDALVGSVFAARSKAPLILVDETLSETVVTYLRNNGIIGVTIFGGEAVISNGIQQELSQLVGK